MTYTYDPALADNVSLVRFHIGDNSDEGHFLEDETIQYFLTMYGVGIAVVRSIEYIITQLSQPDFSLGWMNVSNAAARAGYEQLLQAKSQQFNLNASGTVAASTVKLPWRPDSYMTSGAQDGKP